MPNRNYYQANKEKLKEQAKIRYSNKSIEEKEKSKEYYRNWYNNLDEDKNNQMRVNGKNRYHNMNDEQMQKHKGYQKILLFLNFGYKHCLYITFSDDISLLIFTCILSFISFLCSILLSLIL